MGRAILAVIVSYILMFVISFAAFTGLYLMLHADGSFKPGSFEASGTWIAAAFVINFVVAILGGWICAAIAKGGRAPIALAVLVIVLGLALAVPALRAQKKNAGLVRGSAEVPMLEAMQKAQQPSWLHFAFPVLVATGVLIGARLKRRT